MPLSLVFISRASTLPYSRSRTYLSYNATGGGEGGKGTVNHCVILDDNEVSKWVKVLACGGHVNLPK